MSSLKMGVVLDIIVRIILPSENVVFVISHVSDSMTTGVLGEFHKPMSPGPFVLLCKWPISKRIFKALLHYALFHLRFGYQHVGTQNTSENM